MLQFLQTGAFDLNHLGRRFDVYQFLQLVDVLLLRRRLRVLWQLDHEKCTHQSEQQENDDKAQKNSIASRFRRLFHRLLAFNVIHEYMRRRRWCYKLGRRTTTTRKTLGHFVYERRQRTWRGLCNCRRRSGTDSIERTERDFIVHRVYAKTRTLIKRITCAIWGIKYMCLFVNMVVVV